MYVGAGPQFVATLIEELFDWAKHSTTSALIKSCVMHYETEEIHLFADGNVRMRRFWQNVVLSQWQPIFTWIPIETIIYEHQQRFYYILAIADKQNSSNVFIEFMLDVMVETLHKYPKKDYKKIQQRGGTIYSSCLFFFWKRE